MLHVADALERKKIKIRESLRKRKSLKAIQLDKNSDTIIAEIID
jgi:hypothetical protein